MNGFTEIRKRSTPGAGPLDPSSYSLEGIRTEGSTNIAIHANTMIRNGTGIYMYSNGVDDVLTCNGMYRCYPGVYLDYPTSLPTQGSDIQSNLNHWHGDYSVSGRLKVAGAIANPGPANWYYNGSLVNTNDYCPEPFDPFAIYAQPVTGFNGGDPPCGGAQQMRTSDDSLNNEEALSRIVTDSMNYGGSDANEKRYNIRESSYKIMKSNSNLVTSAAKENFMQQTETENMGLLVAVNDSLATGDLSAASNINSTVIDTNIIESNKLAVNNIIITLTVNGVLVLNASDSAVLLNIAYQDAAIGGEAVYRARAILRLRITDHSNFSQARKAQQSQPSVIEVKEVYVYPVPSTGLIFINSNDIAIAKITLYDVTGRLLLSNILKTSVNFYKLDLSNIVAGAYTLKVIDVFNKVISHKMIIAK